jgi:translocation and assembly module TamB
MRPAVRRSLRILSIAALAVVLLAGGGLAYLQTTSGKAWLAGTLSRALSSADMNVTLSSVQGSVPFDLRVGRIVVADRDGAWLSVTDAAIDVASRDLLRGRLTVRHLGAREIALMRLPAAEPAPTEAEPTSFAIPELPIGIEVRALAVPRIHLAEPVLGEAVTTSLHGAVRLTAGDAVVQLAVERVDGQPGHARLALNAQKSESISLKLDIAEPSGALLKQALGRDEPIPLAVAIDGAGPLANWRGTLHARAGDVAAADATFTITNDNGYRIVADGTAVVTALLPANLAALAPRPLHYAAAAVVNGDLVSIESFELTGGAIDLKAHGQYDQGAETFAGEAAGLIADLRVLETIAGTPLAGTADVTVKAEGTLDTPRARVTLAARDLRSGDTGAGAASAAADVALENRTWRLTGSGAFDALALPLDRPGVPKRLDWDIAAQADDSFTALTFDRLQVRSDTAALTAAGKADLRDRTPKLDGTARLDVADLSRFQDLATLPLEGQLALDIKAESRDGTVVATIDGQTQAFGGVQPALDALLGKQVRLQGSVSRGADGTITANAIRLAGEHATAAADASLSADFAHVDGKAQVDLPRLAILSQPLATPVEGTAKARVDFSGKLTQLKVNAHADAAGLRFGAQRLDKLGVELNLTDAAAPAGTLAATFIADALDGRANAKFSSTAPDKISVSKLSISAPGTTVDGALDVMLDKTLVAGTLNAQILDLAVWSGLAGTGLAGAADARATFSAKDGQRADIDASVRDLRLKDAGASASRIKVEARLADLFGKPSGKATIDASAVAAPAVRVDTVRMVAQSSKPGQFAVTADARGALHPGPKPSPFRLSTASEITVTDRAQQLRITRLTGRVGAHDIASQSPLTVAVGPNGLRFDGLDLKIDQGRLSGSGARNGEQLALKIEARDLPLKLVELATPDQRMAGTLGASLGISGTVARPEGRFEAQIRDFRPEAAGKDMPPLAMTARGTWKDARVELTGRVDGPEKTGLDLAGAMPLRLDPKTVTPTVPGNGAIQASARGGGRLETWANVLPLGEDRISGRYDIDISIGGTLEAPRAGGRVAVAEGRYVNFAAGTELRNLGLELVGAERRFTLKHFSATDAAEGTITGGGFIDLAAASGAALDFSAQFANFQVMRRDDVQGAADGELRLSGPVAEPILSGKIRMNRAEIRIPEKLPSSIVRLDVVEIDSRSGTTPAKPEEPAGSETAIRLDLALDVPARAFVRGRGLDSEWKGAAHVGGTVAKPVITGKLEAVRGEFSFLTKRFTLAASAIEFDGSDTIDPTLNVVAEHKSSTIVAQAIITGHSSDPTIKLTSQPELPQDEVLSHVLFGRGAGEITPMQGLELAQAAATLAGRGGGPGIMDRVRTATGLDRLDISSGASTASGASGTKLEAGEYISEKVFVGIEQGAEQQSTRTKVEVEVLPNVTVDSSVGANSSAGVGVNWKWDY